MKKRLTAFVLALSMVSSWVPLVAKAGAEKTTDCADVTAEMLPEELREKFTLYGLPEVLTDDGYYRSADSFERIGKAIVYHYRENCGLVDKDGSVLTDPVYSAPYRIADTDMVFLPLADGSGIHVLNDSTGEITGDLVIDADGTCNVFSEAGMCSVEMDGKTVILSSEGEVLQKGLADIVSYLPLAEGAMAVGRSDGLYAVVNRTGMTDFRYSQIGGGNSPNCRSGMVYATRGDLAGFINLETLEEAAFRYDFGSTITSTGIVTGGYAGNYALILRQDPDTNALWYDVLDKSGKTLYSISDEMYSLSGYWFYRDAGLAYQNADTGKLRLLTLTDEGVATVDLSGYLKDFRYTTANGVTYGGCFNTFEYGVIEVQDSASGECVLLDLKGQELLRGYDCLDKEIDVETGELLCITAQDAAGKYSFCLPGGSFTGYLYDEIITYGDYVRATVTDENGEVCYQLFSPTGTRLFADLTVTDFTVEPDNGYAYAWTQEGVYLCHLSSGTLSGPYEELVHHGQNRFTVQEEPCSMIDGKGNLLAESVPGYIRYFSEGFAEYTGTADSHYRGLIDLGGNSYDFGWQFDLLECQDDDYNFDYFYEGTAVLRLRDAGENSDYLLCVKGAQAQRPDPQLLYSAPGRHAVGLPLFGTITLTFDRPVTLPDEEDVKLVCVSDGEEIALSAAYGNGSGTVLRFALEEEMLSCGEKYSLLIGAEAIWPQSGEEKAPFVGFTQEDDFTFTISEDGLTLSDLDLIRYFPQYLFNKTASSFENAAADTYGDIINHLSLNNDLRISFFHALRDPVNAFLGYLPGVSAARHRELVDGTAYALMGAVSQQDNNETAKIIAAWAESVSWAGKLSEDDAFVEGLGVFLKPTDLDQFARALQKLDEAADAMTFTVDLCSIYYTIVTTELINRVTIEQLRDAIPYDCHLKQGLNSLLRSIDDPNYLVEKYLLDNRMLKVMCDAAEDVVFSETGMLIGAMVGTEVVLDGGVVMFAKLILNSFSAANEVLGGASYNDINELLLLSGFAAALNSAVISCRGELVKTGEDCTQEMADEYRTIYSAYLTCLKLTLQSAANIATPAEMGGDISLRTAATAYAEALGDGTYSYDVYMGLCKKNALNEASGQYLYDVMAKTNAAVLTGTPAAGAVSLLSAVEEESGTTGDSGTAEEENGGTFFLPDQIDGYPVASVGTGHWTGNGDITVLVIPDTVEEIGEGAFAGCTALKYVVLGENVKSIGADAFGGCSGLISVNLPGSLETVGSGAFAECGTLSRVSVEGDGVQADDTAFPENVLFVGTELSCAAELAGQFAGTAMISAQLEGELKVLSEPDRLYYAPEEWIGGEGMILEADGGQIEDGWVICHGTDDSGKPMAVVHYLGKKTTFPIFVGEDELHFPNLYHLQIPTWEEGTAVAAAYDANNCLTEVFLFEEACGTVFVLPWQTKPDHVKGFLLGEGEMPLTPAACLTQGGA